MSTKKILLVSEKQIKEQSIIEHNTDSKLLSKVILNVQETQLKQVLQAELYKSVLSAVNENVTNNTPLIDSMKELLEDYIVPFLIYATLCDFIVINNFKLSNKGLMKVNDNSAQSVSSQDLEYVKNYYDNYLSTYKSNLIQYLKDNKELDRKADTNITSNSIGWYLEQRHFFGCQCIECNRYGYGYGYSYQNFFY